MPASKNEDKPSFHIVRPRSTEGKPRLRFALATFPCLALASSPLSLMLTPRNFTMANYPRALGADGS
jgi:hypothetical protein